MKNAVNLLKKEHKRYVSFVYRISDSDPMDPDTITESKISDPKGSLALLLRRIYDPSGSVANYEGWIYDTNDLGSRYLGSDPRIHFRDPWTRLHARRQTCPWIPKSDPGI